MGGVKISTSKEIGNQVPTGSSNMGIDPHLNNTMVKLITRKKVVGLVPAGPST